MLQEVKELSEEGAVKCTDPKVKKDLAMAETIRTKALQGLKRPQTPQRPQTPLRPQTLQRNQAPQPTGSTDEQEGASAQDISEEAANEGTSEGR